MVKPAETLPCQSGRGMIEKRSLYPKDSWCAFCPEERLLANIQRHYELKHNDESLVMDILELKKKIKLSSQTDLKISQFSFLLPSS